MSKGWIEENKFPIPQRFIDGDYVVRVDALRGRLEKLVQEWRKAAKVCGGMAAEISGETLDECADELERDFLGVTDATRESKS